jgi:aminoglycoside phosphotransferase (APT) family kinase protein
MSDAATLAAAAATEWGLPAPVLERKGMNSLFTAGDDVLLRVGVPSFAVSEEREWEALVTSVGVRIPRRLNDMKGRGPLVVTAIERVHSHGEVDFREVGAMIHRLHSVDALAAPDLPWCGHFPHWQVEHLLGDVRDRIDAAALAGIDACVKKWAGWRDQLREQLVVCHGDVHPGNVIQGADGPVLLDWDLRCMAPAGWDHGPLLQWGERWSNRWGGGPQAYDDFAEGYGRSLRDEWMTRALADLRMVVATLLRMRAGRTDSAAAAEAERRLQFWRGDPDAPLWEPQ